MRLQILSSLLFGVVLSTSSYAGTAGQVKIRNINFMSQGVVIFYVEGARNGAPACATEGSRFALDVTTPGGKAQLAGILTAYAMGKPVNVYGTSACNLWGDTETVDFFQTAD
ncbi:hypothetical protein OU995_09835 [Roseateles sp. SL47]|uniref:hypothetical protein n=1 Tax=Roseateles sp. SL47 TaxID=2995138 RepID=UPI002271DC45|nr:hypothetical protein [Roseateles sp. SL47]WAC74965.1 hypothetical protein OU995_09835 [Roseateles sp. SL47]